VILQAAGLGLSFRTGMVKLLRSQQSFVASLERFFQHVLERPNIVALKARMWNYVALCHIWRAASGVLQHKEQALCSQIHTSARSIRQYISDRRQEIQDRSGTLYDGQITLWTHL